MKKLSREEKLLRRVKRMRRKSKGATAAMDSSDEYILAFLDRMRESIITGQVSEIRLEKMAEAFDPEADCYVLRVRILRARTM
ncbi:MAG TPA: hypothetical protein VGS10_07825 [Terracidiphilus sp.]|nr:hypothetical protein [Terracidiphilus sp.]